MSIRTNGRLTKNQRVMITEYYGSEQDDDGIDKPALKIISLQRRSTPGIYKEFFLPAKGTYQLTARGWNSERGGAVHLWIGDYQRETLYWSKDVLHINKSTTLSIYFNNGAHQHVMIGLLFDEPDLHDFFILMELKIITVKRGQANVYQLRKISQADRNKINHTIEYCYDKYWRKIIQMIGSNQFGTLKDLWWQIVQFEFQGQINPTMLVNGERIVCNIVKGHTISRTPILQLIKKFKPDAVAELGSGWGKNLFYLFLNGAPHNKIDYHALELTEGGLRANTLVAQFLQGPYRLNITPFDFENPHFPFEHRYQRLLVFTMWSLKEITHINKMFFYKLLDQAECIVGAHLEPIGWQISNTSVTKKHSYLNSNLYTLLLELANEGRIIIDKIRLDFFGFTARNCATLIVWRTSVQGGVPPPLAPLSSPNPDKIQESSDSHIQYPPLLIPDNTEDLEPLMPPDHSTAYPQDTSQKLADDE